MMNGCSRVNACPDTHASLRILLALYWLGKREGDHRISDRIRREIFPVGDVPPKAIHDVFLSIHNISHRSRLCSATVLDAGAVKGKQHFSGGGIYGVKLS